jgi:hypothetical protein
VQGISEVPSLIDEPLRSVCVSVDDERLRVDLVGIIHGTDVLLPRLLRSLIVTILMKLMANGCRGGTLGAAQLRWLGRCIQRCHRNLTLICKR